MRSSRPAAIEGGAIVDMTTNLQLPRPHPHPELQMAAKNRILAQQTRTTACSSFRNFIRDFDPDRMPEDATDDAVYALMNERQREMVDGLRRVEALADAELGRVLRRHPLYQWSKTQDGLGVVSLALLLGGLEPLSRFANPGKMLQYCGHGDSEKSRPRRGQKTAYSPAMKTVCIRLGLAIEKLTPRDDRIYRGMYDSKKAEYAARTTHCGKPTCKKTEAGLCSKGHIAAMGRRFAVKQLLISLWVEWMRAYGHSAHDDQATSAVARIPDCLIIGDGAVRDALSAATGVKG